MIKSETDIVLDIWQNLKNSTLAGGLSGKVYRDGYRPKDSKKEDAVVMYVSGRADWGKPQTGVVTINIYVPDKQLKGQRIEDGQRTTTLERQLQAWFKALAIERYTFEQQTTVHTIEDRAIEQHIVTLTFQYYNYEQI